MLSKSVQNFIFGCHQKSLRNKWMNNTQKFYFLCYYIPPAAVREELLDVLFLIVYSIMRYGGAGSNPP
jgi:hypothetical protein